MKTSNTKYPMKRRKGLQEQESNLPKEPKGQKDKKIRMKNAFVYAVIKNAMSLKTQGYLEIALITTRPGINVISRHNYLTVCFSHHT